MKAFNQRAITCLCNRINELVNYYPSLKDLCEDEDYVTMCIKTANYLFWLDQNKGMTWVAARYIEGLAYSTPLREGLLDVFADWQPYLGAIARRSLLVLQQGEWYSWRAEESEARRELLEADAKRSWLTDTLIDNRYEQERQKIRLWSASASLMIAGDIKTAIEFMTQAAAGEIPPALSKRIAARARSVKWRAEKEPELVEQALSAAIRIEPGNADNWRSMGLFLDSIQRHKEAEEFFAQATKMEPDNYFNWIVRGNNASWLRQYEIAIQYHRKAIELSPEEPEAWISLANDLAWLLQPEKAVEYFEKAIELRPNDARTSILLGNNYLFLRQYEKAVKHYSKGTESEHNNSSAWHQLAYTMTLLCRDNEADEYIQRSLKLEPNNQKALTILGFMHMMTGRRDEAVKALQASIAADEKYPNPHSLWARILYRENDLERCAEKFNDALRFEVLREPRFLFTLISLIVVNRLLDRPIDVGWIESAKRLETYPDPFNRAQWLAVFGSEDQAIANLAEAISETPNHVRYALFCPAFHNLRHDPRFIQLTARS